MLQMSRILLQPMKSFLLLAALSLFPISPLFSESESPPRCPAANAPATELQRLQQQYERRRREALLAHRWLWRSDEDANGVATTFQPDGTVEHSGMRGTWRVTGPCEVTIL